MRVIFNVLSAGVFTYYSRGSVYANSVAICNCIENSHFYNDIWVVKLFVCYHMIMVLLPFWTAYGEYFIDLLFYALYRLLCRM